MKIRVREIELKDYKRLQSYPEMEQSSYELLHSVLGYSLTERKVEHLSQGKPSFYEFVVESLDGDPLGFVRLGSPDHISKTLRVQGFVRRGGSRRQRGVKGAVRDLLGKAFLFQNITRFYSFLFDHETIERDILTSLGFVPEVTLARHVFFSGSYKNVLVYGKNQRKSA